MRPVTPSPAASPTAPAHPVRTRAPRHLAVILDGNRRWAESRGVPLAEAYRVGARRVRELLRWCDDSAIPFVTVWGLSRDNLLRPPEVVEEIVCAIVDGLREVAAEGRWPVKVIGDLADLPHKEQAEALQGVVHDTVGAPGSLLTVAVAYDGRRDLVAAAQELVGRYADGTLTGELTEERLASFLATAGQPDIDLLIRTSGENRLSGFMPWQAACAELYFTPVCWPDFDRHHFAEALAAYAARERRRGL